LEQAAAPQEKQAKAFSVTLVEDLRFQVERHRLVAARAVISRADSAHIERVLSEANMWDPITDDALRLAGFLGRSVGILYMASPGTGVPDVVDPGTVLMMAEEPYLGLAHTTGIDTVAIDGPNGKPGWSFRSTFRAAVRNPKAVSVARFS
jgi:hypothetical protein